MIGQIQMILVLVFHNRYRTTLWNLNGTKNNINMFKFRIKQKSLKMWRHYLAERGRQLLPPHHASLYYASAIRHIHIKFRLRLTQ